MTRKPILCLDFDGVLHSYSSGWAGADVIPDPPVPGAMAFILDAMRAFRVSIFSSRSGQEGGKRAMQEYLVQHMETELRLHRPDRLYERACEIVYSEIEWPDEKPPAMVTIDDRALTFSGVFPSVEQLQAFKPWNKK